MIDQIIKTIQDTAKEAVQSHSGISAEQSEGVANVAAGSIVDSIKGLISNGQIGDIMQMVNNPANSQASQLLQNDFVKNIVSKLGIDTGIAGSLASSIIPMILSKLSLDKLMSGGAQGGGFDMNAISSMLAKTGLDKDGDGDVDLKDITKMFGF
jgi:uncharacterized protein YidB (DUF937 family)